MVAGAATLIVTPAALAADPPTPDPGSSAVNAYVETLPTGAGARAVGQTSGKKSTLPAKTRAKVAKQDPATAKALEEIATSAVYGAPQTTLPAVAPTKPSVERAAPNPKPAATPKNSRPTAPGARTEVAPVQRVASQGASSSLDGGTNPILYLALVAGLGTIAVGAAAVLRRRGRGTLAHGAPRERA